METGRRGYSEQIFLFLGVAMATRTTRDKRGKLFYESFIVAQYFVLIQSAQLDGFEIDQLQKYTKFKFHIVF